MLRAQAISSSESDDEDGGDAQGSGSGDDDLPASDDAIHVEGEMTLLTVTCKQPSQA